MSEELNEDNNQFSENNQREESLSSIMDAMEGLGGGPQLKEGLSMLEEAANPPATTAPEEKIPAVNPNDTKGVADGLLKEAVKPAEVVDPEDTGIKPGEEEIEDGTETEKPVDPEEKKESSLKINSPIFGGEKIVGDKPATETLKFEGSEDVDKYLKETVGVDNLKTLVDNYSDSKEKLVNFDKTQAEVARYEGIFANMPTELYQGVEAFLKGNDWKAPILSKPNVDFTKDVENQSEKTLVESYFPSQFSAEEWEDYNSEEPDAGIKKAINLAISSAKEKFTNDKIGLDGYKQSQIDSATEFNKKMSTSVAKSVEYLSSKIEGIDKGYITQVSNELSIQGLNELFFNPDGTFKEDAALNYTMAKQGYDLLEQYKGIAKHQSETKERQTILDRAPATPKAKTKQEEGSDATRPEVKQKLDELVSGMNPRKTY